jgi:hypothetical protein
MSRDALATLQKEFPFCVHRSDGTLRLFLCTEKPHSMVHWASNWRTVGRPRTISTNVTMQLEELMQLEVRRPELPHAA